MPEPKKKFEARKATGTSVEDFYTAQDEAFKTDKDGNYLHPTGARAMKTFYSCLILARVEPMPAYDEFKGWLDEDIVALVERCKFLNPRHFASEALPVDEKKSES